MYSRSVLTRGISKSLIADIVKVVSLTFILSLFSHLRFYLPFSPVPVTLQTLVVFLGGAFLGRKSVYSIACWILLGILGLPVFSNGAGFVYLLGPTGGYILGFLLAGIFLPKMLSFKRNAGWYAVSFLSASIMIYGLGLLQLKMVLGLSFYEAFVLGVLPFMYGWLLKITLAVLITRLIKR